MKSLDPEILEAIYTHDGLDLRQLSQDKYIMLVFLRHFGCTFCREALGDLGELQTELDKEIIEIILVHMSDEDTAQEQLERNGLAHLRHISDPDLSLYEYFGLGKGRFNQIYGLKVWLRGFKVAWLDGRGRPQYNPKFGSVSQMPGVFLIKNCSIQDKFVHRSAADRPDYRKIVNCCQVPNKS